MTPLFAKLNLKDHRTIHVLDAPPEFEAELAQLDGVVVKRTVAAGETVAFGIAFATTQRALDAASRALTRRAADDAVVWIAYPKGTSKRYTCEFNRDSGFTTLGDAGYEGVRQVAIDADWSALRFRQVRHIKTVTRDPKRALTAEGKARTAAGRRR